MILSRSLAVINVMVCGFLCCYILLNFAHAFKQLLDMLLDPEIPSEWISVYVQNISDDHPESLGQWEMKNSNDSENMMSMLKKGLKMARTREVMRFMVDENHAIPMRKNSSKAQEAKEFLIHENKCKKKTIKVKSRNGNNQNSPEDSIKRTPTMEKKKSKERHMLV